MSGVDLDRYLLSEVESRRIFERKIVPKEMAQTQRVDQPAALFIAGQPGAGKTRTTDEAIAEFGRLGTGVVVINSDTYKPYHPQWRQLLAADDTTAALYTRLDGRRWMDQAYDWAIDNRRHVIVETTMQGPDVFEVPAARFAAAGYQIEVQVMAVAEPMSRLGILERYAAQVEQKGSGRLTAVSNHDEAFRGMGERLTMLDAGRVPADVLSVSRRGGELLYANQRVNGVWVAPPVAAEVFKAECARQWTYPEAAAFLSQVHRVDRMLPAGPVKDQLAEVRALASPLLPVAAEAYAIAQATFPRLSRPTQRAAAASSTPQPAEREIQERGIEL